jgi:hypothetical protein
VTKAKKPVTPAIEGYRVRVSLGGALLHVLSATEPVLMRSVTGDVADVAWTPIEGTDHGDTVGYIRWSEVTAITWRKAS